MSTEYNEVKFKKARKNVIIGGMVILVAITLLSCVSSFMIYREGFADMPTIFQFALAFFAVIVVEGAFIWLVYGFTRAFSSFWERLISFLAMWALAFVMLVNIITHFMMVKRIELHPFQQAWLAWGAVSVFIGVLVIVLAITLADPVIRLIRLELRFLGKRDETIINARREGLDSEQVHQAVAQRAEIEAEQLAARILGSASQKYLQPHIIKGFGDGGQSSSYSQSPAGQDYDPKQ
jgi:MFS family permease